MGGMNVVEIEKRLRQRPFLPFQFRMSDGSAYNISRPEMVIVGQSIKAVGLHKPRSKRPEEIICCDPRHIIGLEPTPNGRPKKSRSTKRKNG